MLRRSLILGSASSVAGVFPRSANASERVIGWMSGVSSDTISPFLIAFRQGLKEALPARAAPVTIIERNAPDGNFAAAIGELERLGARLIVAQGPSTVAVALAKSAVPILFGYSGDPVAAGVVQSLARPGGNATGVSFLSTELVPKRISLLRSAVPKLKKIALISNVNHPGEESEIDTCRQVIEPQGLHLTIHRMKFEAEISAVVEDALRDAPEAILLFPSATMVRHAGLISNACLSRKVSLASGWASIAKAGALMTYGPNLQKSFFQLARLALKVLDGANPAITPVEQPTSFEFVLNAATARALGLQLDATLMAQVDQVLD